MIKLTRRELYKMVWRMPLTKIAEMYAISDVGLRKACLRMNIPVPNAGYWSKVYAGQNTQRPELPERFNGKDYLELKLREEGQPVKTPSQRHKAVKTLAVQHLPFKVPLRLTSPHPSIVAAKASLAHLKDKAFPGMVMTATAQPDIRVTPANVNRSLRIMDTLIKCIYARGHVVVNNEKGTQVIINRVKLKVTFRERTSKVAIKGNPFKSVEWHPNGKLAFRLEGRLRAEWTDGKTKPLEEQIANILAKLELVAAQEEEHALQLKHWQEERERERIKRIERERRQQEEITTLKQQLSNAARWEKAAQLRRYAAALKDADSELAHWTLQKADWLDPLVELNDEWLTETDKLTFD